MLEKMMLVSLLLLIQLNARDSNGMYTKSECHSIGGFWGLYFINGKPVPSCDKKPTNINKKVKTYNKKKNSKVNNTVSCQNLYDKSKLKKKSAYSQSECKKARGTWKPKIIKGKLTFSCKNPKSTTFSTFQKQCKKWKDEVENYTTHEELCKGIGVDWNYNSCTDWSVTTYIREEQKMKYKFMLPYVLEAEKKNRVMSTKNYDIAKKENRIYAGIAMDTSLIGNGKTAREINTYLDNSKGCNIKIGHLSGIAREKNGLVDEITLSQFNTSLQLINKVINTMDKKYTRIDSTEKEEYRSVDDVRKYIYAFNTPSKTSSAYVKKIFYDKIKNAKAETIKTVLLTYDNKGDKITLKYKTTKGVKTTHDLEIKYISRKTVLEENKLQRIKQQENADKRYQENLDMQTL